MNTEQVRKLAKEHMEINGIGHWNLVLGNSKGSAGRCERSLYHKLPHRSKGLIRLSMHFMDMFPDSEVLDTILHEIAHALVVPGVKPHGPEWKYLASKLGARPKASFDLNDIIPKRNTPVVAVKKELSWKEKFDQGMTSFGDDW